MLWLKAFRDAAVFVPVTQTVSDCRDPKDNPFLALALAAQADALVSSDIHLLEMHPYQGIPILRLSDFKARMLSE
jgi:putative PIN family toxin of toxin-antitoxin system